MQRRAIIKLPLFLKSESSEKTEIDLVAEEWATRGYTGGKLLNSAFISPEPCPGANIAWCFTAEIGLSTGLMVTST